MRDGRHQSHWHCQVRQNDKRTRRENSDITDPDTNTDVTPVKSEMTFMRHWVFACKKAIQKAVLKTIQDDSTYKGSEHDGGI